MYEPRFFNKEVVIDAEGNKSYKYSPKGNKYWEDREAGKFGGYMPKIFEEDCTEL